MTSHPACTVPHCRQSSPSALMVAPRRGRRRAGWPLECQACVRVSRAPPSSYIVDSPISARRHIVTAHPDLPADWSSRCELRLTCECAICLDHLPDFADDEDVELITPCCNKRWHVRCVTFLYTALSEGRADCPSCRTRIHRDEQPLLAQAIAIQLEAELFAHAEG